jgi:CBS domain-containing protein
VPGDVGDDVTVDVTGAGLAEFLGKHRPFSDMAASALAELAAAAVVADYGDGDLVLDAFSDPTVEVFVLLEGRVNVWNDSAHLADGPDEVLDPGGLFGFSAMLTERSVGPRVVASGPARIARIPGSVASAAFMSRQGARFLAQSLAARSRGASAISPYSNIEDLVTAPALVAGASDTAADVARQMSQSHTGSVAVRLDDGTYGLVTDASLRQRIIVDGLSPQSPASAVLAGAAPSVHVGDSAAEALIRLLDEEAEQVLVLDAEGRVCGMVSLRDFAVSSTAADVSLHEQLRRAGTVEELARLARGIPAFLGELLARGLASGRVIALYSTIIDTTIRRAIRIVFAAHPELDHDAFTWLSLGSNGRRETVLSSDVDSAVAFTDAVAADLMPAYRAAFGEVHDVLAAGGLSRDWNGATASREPFARSNSQWRAAAHRWMASPELNQGAIMASLLVDGRPIEGDPGLPAAMQVFTELRQHPGTMRLLLEESLAHRARLRKNRDALRRRPADIDIKEHALLPVVNLARWAALTAGSQALGTTDRLRAAAGSTMLPDDRAATLVEVFDMLQRLRLRYQLMQHQSGELPSDTFSEELMSPMDRSVVAQAVREIASVQKRMTRLSVYVPTDQWSLPTP